MEIPSLMLPPRTSCTHCTDEEKRQSLTSLSLSVGFLRSKIESRSPPPKVWRERERERLFRCPNRRESRPLPTCTRRREGQGPLFFSLSPFLLLRVYGGERRAISKNRFGGVRNRNTVFTTNPLSPVPAASSNNDVINPVASLTSSYNSQRLHRFFRAA